MTTAPLQTARRGAYKALVTGLVLGGLVLTAGTAQAHCGHHARAHRVRAHRSRVVHVTTRRVRYHVASQPTIYRSYSAPVEYDYLPRRTTVRYYRVRNYADYDDSSQACRRDYSRRAYRAHVEYRDRDDWCPPNRVRVRYERAHYAPYVDYRDDYDQGYVSHRRCR